VALKAAEIKAGRRTCKPCRSLTDGR
jgi:hypothetical protein